MAQKGNIIALKKNDGATGTNSKRGIDIAANSLGRKLHVLCELDTKFLRRG